jgi:predicted amidohydrolase
MASSARVALGQFGAELGDVGANLEHMRGVIAAAADDGAELVCFPELSLSGYLLHPADYSSALLDSVERAQRELAAEGRRHGVGVVYGAPLRSDGGLRNAVILQAANGGRLVYAKTHMVARERGVFVPGSEFVVDERGIGLACCYDLAFPEAGRILVLRGARLLLAPMAWEVERGFVMRHVAAARAVENVAHVVCVNQSGIVGDLRFRGASCVVDPLGQTAVTLGREAELAVVDIDLDWVERLRDGRDARTYPLFDDRRPELYGAIGADEMPREHPCSVKSDMCMLRTN